MSKNTNPDGKGKGEFTPELNPLPSEVAISSDPVLERAVKIVGNIKHRICEACNEEKPQNAFKRKKNAYTNLCLACESKVDSLDVKDAAWKLREEKRLKKAAEASAKRNFRYRESRRAAVKAHAKERAEVKKKKELTESVKASNQADRELASRVLARRKLIYFIQKFMPNYESGWVHEDICNRLERFFQAVKDGKSPRLILAMPPRHGKSEIASKNFPAWVLGHSPEFEIIASSYNVSLPMGFSRKVKDLIQSPLYRQIFPKTALSKTSQAAEAWLTTKGGGYVAAGVGGGITGKGAHIFIIDDPVKDSEEADSETMRDKTWDWWGSTAKTRLAPGGGVLVIQTRWHDADLAGKMLLQMKEQKEEMSELIDEALERLALTEEGDQIYINIQEEIKAYQAELDAIDDWEVVSYPAIATDDEYEHKESHKILQGKDIKEITDEYRKLRSKGDPLHESRFPTSRLVNMKKSMQPRHWSALYQQNPVPDEGIFFKKEMFRMEPYIARGHKYKIYIAWDLAIGEKQTNDYTVGAVVGVDYIGQIHVLDIIRGRWDSLGIVNTILDTAVRYDPHVIGIERGQLEMAIRPTLNDEMKRRKLYFTFADGADALVPITDKTVRARPLQGKMQQGMVFFPSNQPWVEQAMFELMRFPGGVHDDVVDALAWAIRVALKHPPPQAPKQTKIVSWKDKLKLYTAGRGEKTPMAS